MIIMLSPHIDNDYKCDYGILYHVMSQTCRLYNIGAHVGFAC